MFFIRFILVILLFVSLGYSAEKFNQKQTNTVKVAYQYGKKFGFGLVMAGLVIQESSAGKYLQTKTSYGVFQINLSTASKRYKISRKALKRRLLNDKAFSAQCAKDELMYWNAYWGKKFSGEELRDHVIASYNNGYVSNTNKHGKMYLASVKKRIKQARKIVDDS
jgi:hypothetical protein